MSAETHSGRFLAASASIAGRLCRDAVWSGNRCAWVGAAMEFEDGQWRVVHRACGPELYAGTAGIGLYLACAFQATGEAAFAEAASGALRHALIRARGLPPQAAIGLYSGATGVAYAALHAAGILARDDLRAAAIDLLAAAVDDGADLSALDVLGGCAGAIHGLLTMHQSNGGDWMVDAAARMGERLIAAAHKAGLGWSWDTLAMPGGAPQRHLLGYSHGAGGIGVSLLELWRATEAARYGNAAEMAFAYEMAHFDAGHRNWPDLRDPGLTGNKGRQGEGFMTAWCHGAPGIALSRVRAWQLTGEPQRMTEARAALATTRESIADSTPLSELNCSLCHGGCGNSDVLLWAANALDEPDLKSAATVFADRALGEFGEAGYWPCGVMGGDETPGLMLGLAGIGLFYLRMDGLSRAPSALVVCPDRSSPEHTGRPAA